MPKIGHPKDISMIKQINIQWTLKIRPKLVIPNRSKVGHSMDNENTSRNGHPKEIQVWISHGRKSTSRNDHSKEIQDWIFKECRNNIQKLTSQKDPEVVIQWRSYLSPQCAVVVKVKKYTIIDLLE